MSSLVTSRKVNAMVLIVVAGVLQFAIGEPTTQVRIQDGNAPNCPVFVSQHLDTLKVSNPILDQLKMNYPVLDTMKITNPVLSPLE